MNGQSKSYIWADGNDILEGAHEADIGLLATAVSPETAKWIVEQIKKSNKDKYHD